MGLKLSSIISRNERTYEFPNKGRCVPDCTTDALGELISMLHPYHSFSGNLLRERIIIMAILWLSTEVFLGVTHLTLMLALIDEGKFTP